jgi:hypothetical protein
MRERCPCVVSFELKGGWGRRESMMPGGPGAAPARLPAGRPPIACVHTADGPMCKTTPNHTAREIFLTEVECMLKE